MSIEIANESGVSVDEASIVAVARYALDRMGVSPLAELSVLLVDLDVMADLHERWMDLPGPTDVMAFPMDELDSARRPDAAGLGPALLGDIVLCPAFAREQARKAGHPLLDELHLLTVHGVLHLLGYDHAEPAEEREMFSLQNRVLADYRTARTEAERLAVQRSVDDRVLGAVGLTGPETQTDAGTEAGPDGAPGRAEATDQGAPPEPGREDTPRDGNSG
ncbi:endoribonuclease YbeY [Longimycelium tulufanense]|uniref:Endoribonuclease YbeY n=1 Tax=Longimycelium tulufanense TaxID=907463 RepID=A0A8J3CIX4_9PSEU|nr:endoribonuclease YbeY [Longimycelium tulufanense]